MIHEILPVGQLQCNCSVFGDEQSHEALVIDPGAEIEEIKAILDRHELQVKGIIITHAHIDHIGGAAKLKELTGAPVYMNENDLELRAQLDVQAGWIGGDTLFRDSIGRTDLPGGNPRQIITSIKEKLLVLGDGVVVIPGHGPATTIGREREMNYFLRGL